MRFLAILVALTLTTLSGCTETPTPAADPAQGTDGGNATAPGNVTAPAGATPNAAPVVDLVADVLNGTAPFNVTLTISGSDPDGDHVTWDVASNGTSLANGTGLPGTAIVAITAAGNHTFTLTVSDGNATVERNITILAIEAATVSAFEPVTLSQDILLACPHCTTGWDTTHNSACIAVITDDNGLDCAFWALTEEMQGRKWTAGGLFVPLVEFYPDCSGEGLIELSLDGTGTIPEGAGCAVMFDIIDPVVTATLRIE